MRDRTKAIDDSPTTLSVPFGSAEISLRTFADVAKIFYNRSLGTIPGVTFDLSAVPSMELLPAVLLLTWSSKLRNSGKSVTWSLPGLGTWTQQKNSDTVALFSFHLGIQEYTQLEKRITGVLRARYPSYSDRLAAIQEMRLEYERKIPENRDSVHAYFAIVRQLISGMRFVAFLERWDFLAWAHRIGVNTNIDTRALEPFIYGRSIRLTGACPVTCLTSSEESELLVETFTKEDDLAKIFAQYSTLGIFASGAFAKILVNEIATNIVEHAFAKSTSSVESETSAGCFGFLTMQAVSTSDCRRRAEEQVAPSFFRKASASGVEVLEVVISDDGPGICRDLEPWMRQHDPDGTRFGCVLGSAGRYSEKDVLIHSLDRIVSSKKDFRRLLHCFAGSGLEDERVSSGLYWVWQTVRSHGGLFMFRSDAKTVWYDFSERPTVVADLKETDFPFCGVQIAIYLPLRETQQSETFAFYGRKPDDRTPYPKTEVAWFGHIRPGSLALSSAEMTAILDRLRSQYLGLGSCPLFAVDLSGIHARWTNKDLVSVLTHFFVELNYGSCTRQSAVVLWNLPSRWERFIRPILTEEISRVISRFPGIASMRPACLIIWDDERFEVPAANLVGSGSGLNEAISPVVVSASGVRI